MREQQAIALCELISRDYDGRIVAAIVRGKRSPKTGQIGCRVNLLLVACQRRFMLTYARQLQKALEAWQCYLLSEEEQARLIATANDQEEEANLESEAS